MTEEGDETEEVKQHDHSLGIQLDMYSAAI